VRHDLLEVSRPKLQDWPRDAHWHEAVNQPLGAQQLNTLRQVLFAAHRTATLVGLHRPSPQE
jgi:hypothetical protein